MKNFSKLILGGLVSMASMQANAAAFVGDRSDFRDETIYFAMTTRFYDGDPTNNVCGWDHQDVQKANNDPDWRGDFKGLIDKLDYIKALGFTAIWITPITQNCSGTDFHGYHSMDFSSVDLRYESRKSWGADQDVTFQSLIDAPCQRHENRARHRAQPHQQLRRKRPLQVIHAQPEHQGPGQRLGRHRPQL